jgi:hypothetical protein
MKKVSIWLIALAISFSIATLNPSIAQLPDPGMVIDPDRTALVITDPQNDF